jgi:ABC-type sugar transport system ATPase subunit
MGEAGLQAQVSLALVLGKRPDLLLLEEPLSNRVGTNTESSWSS